MFRNLVVLAVVVFGLSFTARADDHAHHHHDPSDGPAVTALKLNDGKKWKIDEPLRVSMEAIRNELAKAWEPIHDSTYTAAQYKALGERIEAQIALIVSNCRLPPDADAQLHYVVADIVNGATMMKTDKKPINGAIRVVGALGAYPKFFEHAGWKPLKH